MDELIIQSLRPDAPEEVVSRASRWRAESPENEARYRDVARIWAATGREAPAERVSPTVPAQVVAAAAEERRARLERAEAERVTRLRARTTYGWRAAWATVALAAALAAVSLGIGSGLFPTGGEPVAEFLAEAGGAQTVVLDDGSFVKLAPGSRLQVWDGAEERRVALEGRAFFAVVHEEGRPFVVAADGVETRVLGTRFEVSAAPDGLRTVVVDGLVAVSNDQGSVEVAGGSLARVAPGAVPVTETPEDVYALLDWPTGVMLFQGTPLGRVADEVGRRFGERVEVRGDSLAALRISGSFEEERFEEVVRALCETVGAECSLTPDGAVLRP